MRAQGIEKARGADGREEGLEVEERRGEDEENGRWADGSGECWDFEYQRCMGCGSFGQTDVYDQWN
jgi:hypothetical protein